MKQGTFSRLDTTFELSLQAAQTGTHQLTARVPGGAVVIQDFEGTSGVVLQIPNVFPELGVFEISIFNPDDTELVDGSGCPMTIEVLFSMCS